MLFPAHLRACYVLFVSVHECMFVNSFVSTIYVLKTAAMILLQFPAVIRQIDQVKQYFQDSQTSGTEEMTESQLEITEVLATAIVLVATTLLTAVAFIGVFIDRRGMVTEA